MTAFQDSDSPAFRRSFEQWRAAFSAWLPAGVAVSPLRCESPSTPSTSPPTWDQGAIMQQAEAEGPKSDADLKRERADCRRCEKWRDELARNSIVQVPSKRALKAPSL